MYSNAETQIHTKYGNVRCYQQYLRYGDISSKRNARDLRSVGYYKIRQGVLQQNLSKYYRFESVDALCEQFNMFVNMLKKQKEETKEKYPWLEKDRWEEKQDRQRNIR